MLLGDGLDYNMACGFMKVLWFRIVTICIHGGYYNNVYCCGYKFGKKTICPMDMNLADVLIFMRRIP